MSVIATLVGFTVAKASDLPTGWSKRINQDPMDDTKKTIFFLEPHRITGTTDPVVIGISCEAEAFFIVTYEIIEGDIDDLTYIQIRFDKNKAEVHEAITYGNYSRQAQLRKSSVQTMTKMLQSNEMILGIPIRTDGRIYAWFDVSQANQVLSDCVQAKETTQPKSKSKPKSDWTLRDTSFSIYATNNIHVDNMEIRVSCIETDKDLVTSVRFTEPTLVQERTHEMIKTTIYSDSKGFEQTTDDWLRISENSVKIYGTKMPNLLMKGSSVEFRYPNKEIKLPEVRTAIMSLAGSAKVIKPVMEACE